MTEFRMHGANPEKTYAFFSVPMPEKVYDFSTNTNVLPWDGELNIDVHKAMSEYPDDDSKELCDIIAEENNCHPDNVLVTNGSNEAIYLIASYQKSKQNCVIHPVYGEYNRALKAYDVLHRNVRSPLFIEKSDETVWICNPNNPTGKYLPEDEMLGLFEFYKNTVFVIDEAYRDFLYEGRWNLDVNDNSKMIILRSLTKNFHLCGARIGYVLACTATIKALKERQPTWSVNAVAQQAALVYLSDKGYLQKTAEFYKKEVPRFIGELISLGYEVTPSKVNFFLIKTSDDEKLIKFLLKRGIVVRHTRNFMGLDGQYIRVATRSVDENNIFIKAMKEFSLI